MTARADGRPYQIEVWANPSLDGPGISITGFPASYLDGATVTAPVYVLGTTTAWTVTVASTSIALSMPQADVAAIGEGRYTWVLLVALAAGGKPPIIGGSLHVSRSAKPTASVTSDTFASDPVGVDVALTFTQVLSDDLVIIDGGVPAGSGNDIVDGGAP